MRKHFTKILYLLVALAFSPAHAGAYEDFFTAVKRGDDRTLTQLLQRGFDPNSRNPEGQTALILALRDDATRVAEALWRSAALDVNVENSHGENALMMAALHGRLAWMQRLLERGAQVNKDGWTPLHYAASGPDAKAVAMLLERGATVDARSPKGDTPLMMAARWGSEGAVELLLARGASTTLTNDRNLDALDMARNSGRDFVVARIEKSVKR